MRIYISGPMSLHPNNNFPAFSSAAAKLRQRGHFVINPAELSAPFGTPDEIEKSFAELYRVLALSESFFDGSPSECVLERTRVARSILAADLAAVRSCDAIYLIRGWETSRGAKTEVAEALKCGLKIWPEDAP